MLHESCKIRVMEAFLETAKVALKGNNKKIQYILDDLSIEVLNMEGDDFSEYDYGLLVGNTPRAVELEQAIKNYTQAFLQNGGSLSTVMDIYFSPSLVDMRRKLENAEDEQHQRASEQAQQQLQQQEAQHKEIMEREDRKLQLEDIISQREDATKRYIADLSKGLDMNESRDVDGIEDPLDRDKFNLDVQKHRDDYLLKIKNLDNDMLKHKDQMEAKKVDQSISRIKKKSV
jgi:hypothetical protein